MNRTSKGLSSNQALIARRSSYDALGLVLMLPRLHFGLLDAENFAELAIFAIQKSRTKFRLTALINPMPPVSIRRPKPFGLSSLAHL
jgi:hypothetical protein